MAELVSLSAVDQTAIEILLDCAFGTDRKSRTAYILRDGADYIDEFSFGITDDGCLAGSIQCWPVMVTSQNRHTPLKLVGPVAVHPEVQNAGHGHALMQAMLAATAIAGDPPLVMIGDYEYYGRFGFSAKATGGWKLPGPWAPHRLLLRNPAEHVLPPKGMLEPG